MQEGFDIRISGQDVGRGTFSQRHVEILLAIATDSAVDMRCLLIRLMSRA